MATYTGSYTTYTSADVGHESLGQDIAWVLKSSGTFATTSDILLKEQLIIGGGGAGVRGGVNGGGGSGGASYSNNIILPAGTYSVVIGNGGALGVSAGNTTFNGIIAYGGGGSNSAKDGGSGCGGMEHTTSGDARIPGQPTRASGGQQTFGNAGGYGSSNGNGNGGGGGGLGSAGVEGGRGAGRVWNITGQSITYGLGGQPGYESGPARENGRPNTGDGGSGDAFADANGNGGSGVVILRFLNCSTISTSKTGNGTISSGKCSEPGTDYDVLITPDPNHYIKSLFINGTEVTVSSKDKRGFTYHLTNIQESYDFQVEFAHGFKVTSNICAGGSIVPNYSKCMLGELV